MWLYLLSFGLGFTFRHWLEQPAYTEDALLQAEAITKKNEFLINWITHQKELKKQTRIQLIDDM